MERDFFKMKRDYEELVKKHEAASGRNTNWGAFYVSDFNAVKEAATENGSIDLFTLIDLALTGGFMVGYRAARREFSGGGVQPEDAQEAIEAWQFWQDLIIAGQLNPKRYNREFIEAYKTELNPATAETAPFTLMFNAFLGGLDVAGLLLSAAADEE